MPSARILIRPATGADAGRVAELLGASYAALAQMGCEPALLARALPHMVRPSPALLGCGTWYVAEDWAAGAPLLGCGGWTSAAPGDRPVMPSLGHVRHVATRSDSVRRGIASLILMRCVADASDAGLEGFECLSTIAAESFYARLGFERIEATRVLCSAAPSNSPPSGCASPSGHLSSVGRP